MYRTYFLLFIFIVALLVGAQTALNAFIDPYGTNSPVKFDSIRHVKIHKPFKVLREHPQTIIIGNSRNYYSFDLNQLSGENVYNLSLPGIEIDSIENLFQHVVEASSVKRAFITVDSICDPPARDQDAIDKRFLLGFNNTLMDVRISQFMLFGSLKTTTDSIRYILQDNTASIDDFGRQTVFNEFNFLHLGYQKALERREREHIKMAIKNKKERGGLFYGDACHTNHLESILNLADKNKVELALFINPTNVRYWEISHQLGILENYYLHRNLLSEKLESFSTGRQSAPIRVVDFNKINKITTEILLSASERESPLYWYESSHFKTVVGDKMLRILFDQEKNEKDSLFRILSKDSVDEDYKEQMEKFYAWRRSSRETVEEIEKLILSEMNQV